VKIVDTMRDVHVPANVAVAAIQRAGLPIDRDLLVKTMAEWETEILALEKYIEDKAAEVGTPFKYSAKHGAHPPKVAAFLFKGLGLEPKGVDGQELLTPKGELASDADSLARWASLRVPREDDDPYVTAILQIRSLAKGRGTYLDSFLRNIRADGACHPKFNWALRTARLGAEDPPVHQIPERSEKRVPDGIKACIIPRDTPALDRDAWDPRKHGSCFRWDISGAEAAIRGAMLPYLSGCTDPIAYDYIRRRGDIHSKTASIVYNVPEGTYKKGTYERDAVGKHTFFTKIFGAKPTAVQYSIWDQARIWMPLDKIKDICANWDRGYSGIVRMYEVDKMMLGRRMDRNGWSWCEDLYGRRRAIQIPAKAVSRWDGQEWSIDDIEFPWAGKPRGYQVPEEAWELRAKLNHAFHLAANTPTQSTNAWDTLWMLALCHLGEYVELRVPPMWERDGIPFPEAAGWQFNEGDGPGGRPMRVWHMNTVHDSGWGDCAPGYLEPAAKVIWRRCTSVPLDWRIQADVPYRIELKVGPDMSRMRDYNKVAREFGLEPVPER
jgi:hypothetical protein